MASSLGNCNWKTGLLTAYTPKEANKEFALLKVMDRSTTFEVNSLLLQIDAHTFSLNAVRLPN